jgi:Xaa-Pro dipeptidase
LCSQFESPALIAPELSKEEEMSRYTERIERLSQQLEMHALDYLVLIPGANFTYFTGLRKELSERPFVGFFPASGTPAFIVPRLEQTATEESLPYGGAFYVYTDEDGYERAFKRTCSDLAGKCLGIEYRSMRLLELRQIEKAAPGSSFEEADPFLAQLRMIKDTEEIATMREAVRISEEALRATLDQVRPGQTEMEVQNLLHIELLHRGAHGMGFDPLILSGPRAALPHATTADRTLQSGDCLIIDFGGKIGSYTADITRTVAIGTNNPEWKEIYAIVKEANAAAHRLAKPNVKAENVDRAARSVIEKAGYGEYFTHRTGHGLGLDVHEPPYIVAGDKTPLQSGMTFTIEPGIYIPGKYGVRIEDDVLITEDGCETLSTFPRELIAI